MQFNPSYSLPAVTISLLVGMCISLLSVQLPSQEWVVLIFACASIFILLTSKQMIALFGVVLLGFAFMAFQVNQHLAHVLPLTLEGQKITIVGTISSVVEDSKKPKTKFNFKVSNLYQHQTASKWVLPATIQLSWNKSKPELQPGDTWQLLVKLKRPRNYANPGSFDSEKYFFQQRIVATGYVLDAAENRCLRSDLSQDPINRLRQKIFKAIHASVAAPAWAQFISALVIGVKGNMSEEHMEVLQNTGTVHLLAISGLHIGMLASMCFLVCRFLWRFAPRRWLNIPAPLVAAWLALIVCVAYALLAGFGIATQRSLIMITVLLAGILLQRKVSAVQSFCLALLLVLLWDPFAILSLGFWFSFVAVAFLLYAMRAKRNWLQPQIIIALALLPLNLLFFGKNSIIGPLANSIAIPWVGMLVLPISLIATVCLPFLPNVSALLWKLAASSCALLWPVLQKLALLPVYSWHLPQQYLSVMILAAILGAIWLLMPRGIPGRWWGIFGFAPLLFVQTNAIPYGQAELTLLDVGQGLATVVRTQQHVLVYDTGAKLNDNFDLGSRVVAPFLQTKGIKKIDALMISHADNDHIGGARGLLRKIAAQTVITSDEESLVEFNPSVCVAGQHWEWDGVSFTVLHPQTEIYNKKRNDQSCVLMVQAGEHKALLTGDIEKRSEKQLIAAIGNELQADLMLVPHHGSKTSSSEEFIQTVNPKYALIPVGYKNQYGHPKEQVLQRYRDLDIAVLRTEHDGAISFRLGGDLLPHCYRREQHGFWLGSVDHSTN